MSAYQRFSSSCCLVTRPALSCTATARAASSRATIESSEEATTLRRSRRSRCSIWRRAASARSIHSATLSLGKRSSANLSTVVSGIVALPSAVSRAFSSFRRCRTADIPCRASSAIDRCSSGSAASTSARRALPGRRRLGLGRWGTSGGGLNEGRDGPRRSRRPLASPTPGPRSGRSVRSVRSRRRSPPGRSPPSAPGRRSRRSRRSRSPSLRGRSERSR